MRNPILVGLGRSPKAQRYKRQLETVGGRLALLRDQAKQTNEAFAAGLGVSPEAVRKWMKGKSLPSAECLLLIAAEYARSVDWILGIEPGSMGPKERSLAEERAETHRMLLTAIRRQKREAERAKLESSGSGTTSGKRLRRAAQALDRFERARSK